MIGRLTGTLVTKSPTEVLLDVHGVGFVLAIPLSTFDVLGSPDATVTLFTHLHVREDALQLFGFATEEERDLFRILLSVNGIGPRMGQAILSGVSPAALKSHIATGNTGALTAIPGVGRKIAERLVVELRDKIASLAPGAGLLAGTSGEQSRIRMEALLALASLGYNRNAAEKAIGLALKESSDHEITVESLVKASLRHASK